MMSAGGSNGVQVLKIETMNEQLKGLPKRLSFFDPLAHYMGLLRNIMLKGGENDFVVTRIIYLASIAVVSVIASFRRFHTTLE